MPIPTDGLVEITLRGTYLGQEWANVFHYWDTSNSQITDKPGIAAGFDAQVVGVTHDMLSVNTLIEEVIVRDVLGITADYAIASAFPTGLVAGESVSAFTAIRFDYLGFDKSTRRGYKRFVGVGESEQSGGFLTAAAFTYAQSIEANLLGQIIVGPQSYQPVIYGKATPTDPTRSVVNIVTNVLARQKLTSQTSRK